MAADNAIKITLSILLFVVTSSNAQVQPWLPSPLGEDWLRTHEGFVSNSRVNGSNIAVLFYGDSITRRWQTDGLPVYNEFYVPLGTADYGVGGDSTQHVLWRIMNGEVDNIRPRVCVLKIGTNNIGSFNEFEIARGISAIIVQLTARLPTTRILLVGVLPRNNATMTEVTENINRYVSIFDNGDSIRFLNMVDHFYTGNGSFSQELYLDDLLHLSPAGYVKWHEVMWPLFNEMYLQYDHSAGYAGVQISLSLMAALISFISVKSLIA
ncbi:Platelet-activating factor acetylhydrolase IB subunit alpha2 [Pseudolycoriella hygida]|uniref:Platelet-activating factor acetylhydrolase IB subunit alpha2 n=1 Tax=Pseudolycoriella hygida TaxID=35572 RepID=A0A9Q0MST3_9DIPT|nr:Platelet-activating factor acetylhydrolase IB subunit alpha2 [Pseudolycoriella hygida]